MIRRAALILAILLSCPVAAFAQETPTTVADSREHTVLAGETLWSIARGYYGSPFEWRRVYEANEAAIANPHWIVPGQILNVPGATTQLVEGQTGSPISRTVSRETSRPIRLDTSAPSGRVPGRTLFYRATAADVGGSTSNQTVSTTEDIAMRLRAIPHDVFYSAGWIVGEESVPEEVIGGVAEFADEQEGRVERVSVMPFDRVRVAIDGELPQIGEQLLVVRSGRRIKNVGDVVIPAGIMTVASHQEPGVVAVLANEYDRVRLGDLVMALPSFALEPGVVAQPATSDVMGDITAFATDKEVQSLGDIAFLSLGLGEGLRLGDEYLVYAADDMGWTGGVIGRLQIVGVRANQSTARIVDVEAPLFRAGLRVRLVARMP
jgi:LysM repeat protein